MSELLLTHRHARAYDLDARRYLSKRAYSVSRTRELRDKKLAMEVALLRVGEK